MLQNKKQNLSPLFKTILGILAVGVMLLVGYFVWKTYLTPQKSEKPTTKTLFDHLQKNKKLDELNENGTFPLTLPPDILGKDNPFL